MRNRFFPIALLLLLVAAVPALAGCGNCAADCGAMKTETAKAERPCDQARTGDAMHEVCAEAVEQFYAADALYTCAEHPEVVSADADAICPLSGAKLVKMSDKAVAELRSQKLVGCPMCSIAMPAGAGGDAKQCPVCGMDLPIMARPGDSAMATGGEKAGSRYHGDDSHVMD